ncbi:MAG: pseudouridine synthase [Halanaerobiaceae bacterium]
MERLQKVMAHAGVASRRKSEEIIAQGRVRVNGKKVTEMGYKVDPETDIIEVDGEIISKEKRIYIILNKPEGYVTTVDDPRGRKTVLDLIADILQRIYPVGRLDYDSSGLLLLTNDGDLTYILTHPSHMIDKTYRVEVEGDLSQKNFNHLESGVDIEGGKTAPASTELISRKRGKTSFYITIHEGRNRQIRRMCKALGYKVINLHRTAFGPLRLRKLKPGDYRFLKKDEIKELKEIKK